MTEEPQRFVPAGTTGRGERVKCTICGRSGYVDGTWQTPCIAGHPYVCSCGRKFSTLSGLSRHRGHEARAARTAARQFGITSTPHEVAARPTE